MKLIYSHEKEELLPIVLIGNNLEPRSKENEMKIRRASVQDHQNIVAHNQAMAMETENRILESDKIEPGVAAVLNDSNKGFYLVAEENEKVIGSLMVTFEWSDWRNGIMWWFQSVYVSPEARGKGVFKALYQEVMQMAKAADAKELRLYVEKENIAAQKVYAALGMQLSHYDMWEVKVE